MAALDDGHFIKDDSSASSLHRRKSIADVMGKLFKKKEKIPGMDPNQREHRVSSIYFGDSRGPSRAMSSFDVTNDLPKVLEENDNIAAQKCTPEESISSYFAPTSSPPIEQISLRVLTSSRCALLFKDALFQGHLTLTSRHVRFQSSTLPSRLVFTIRYTDIVAVVPQQHYGAGAIQLATQSRLVKLVNFPARDNTLAILLDEWRVHCRRHLLGLEDNTTHMITAPIVDDNRRNEQERDEILPCGCGEHYGQEILQMKLPTAPINIASIIFGGNLAGNHTSLYSSHFRAIQDGAVIDDADWTLTDGTRQRSLLASIPGPHAVQHYTIKQSIIRETADVISVDVQMHARGYKGTYHLRWCITRNQQVQEGSSLILTGESDTSKATILSKIATSSYDDMMKNLEKRVTIPKKEKETMTMVAQTRDFLSQLLLFLMQIIHPLPSLRRMLLGLFTIAIVFYFAMRYYFQPKIMPVGHIFYQDYIKDTLTGSRQNLSDAREVLSRIKTRLNIFKI
jgi:hypothetical protein